MYGVSALSLQDLAAECKVNSMPTFQFYKSQLMVQLVPSQLNTFYVMFNLDMMTTLCEHFIRNTTKTG